MLDLDAWFDSPAYKAASTTFAERGAFTFSKLQHHDTAKLKEVLGDLYRGASLDPEDITKFEWETTLRYRGANPEEIKNVQLRMGRVWR